MLTDNNVNSKSTKLIKCVIIDNFRTTETKLIKNRTNWFSSNVKMCINTFRSKLKGMTMFLQKNDVRAARTFEPATSL